MSRTDCAHLLWGQLYRYPDEDVHLLHDVIWHQPWWGASSVVLTILRSQTWCTNWTRWFDCQWVLLVMVPFEGILNNHMSMIICCIDLCFSSLRRHYGACQQVHWFNLQLSIAHIPHAYRGNHGCAIDVECGKNWIIWSELDMCVGYDLQGDDKVYEMSDSRSIRTKMLWILASAVAPAPLAALVYMKGTNIPAMFYHSGGSNNHQNL